MLDDMFYLEVVYLNGVINLIGDLKMEEFDGV